MFKLYEKLFLFSAKRVDRKLARRGTREPRVQMSGKTKVFFLSGKKSRHYFSFQKRSTEHPGPHPYIPRCNPPYRKRWRLVHLPIVLSEQEP